MSILYTALLSPVTKMLESMIQTIIRPHCTHQHGLKTKGSKTTTP